MAKTLGIVQARVGSTRLPSKVTRRVGGKSLLEWVIRRVTDCQRLDGVIVAAGDAPENAALAELIPADVPLFIGSERDVLKRFVDAIDEYEPDAVVRVCADNPFVDPGLIDRLVDTADKHPEFDYISYQMRDGRPVILSPVGVFAEWCRADALRRAHSLATSAADREHVTRMLYSRPDKFRVRFVRTPAALDCEDLRLTVDLEEDWDTTEQILDALNPEELDWQQIAGLLRHQPRLRRRMAELNRKQQKV